MVVLVPVFALFLAIAGHAETAVKPAHPVKRTSTGAASAASDAQIESAIRARFAKSKIAADHFQVHVQGGVATITGKTDVVQRKGAATRIAKTSGAAHVVNQIEVSKQAKEKASAPLAENRKRLQVKKSPVAEIE